MDGMSNINSDEFETIFELIVAIVFMMFGAFAMSRMVLNLSNRVEVTNVPDKVEVTLTQHQAEDPFWFTGYQAYMFGWHMDPYSYEELYWISKPSGAGGPYIDGNNDSHVRIGVYDEDGNLIPQFLTWRNQMITGVGYGSERSVKKTIDKVTSNVNMPNFYQGTFNTSEGPLMYHLELTGEFTMGNDLGEDENTGGKKFRWILVPRVKK